jgi:hypothetical protein
MSSDPLKIQIRNLEAKAGFSWWMSSLYLVKDHIFFSLGMGIFFMLSELPGMLGRLPFGSGALDGLLATLLGGGSLAVYAAWDKGERVSFGRFFVGFYDRKVMWKLFPLVLLVGGIGLVADLLLAAEQTLSNPDFWTKHTFVFSWQPQSLFFYLLVACCYAFYFLALQFFLPLIYFADQSLGACWLWTRDACLVNWKAMFVNLISGLALLALAALPMGLGILLFFPMMLALPYVMFRENFTCSIKSL